MYAIRDIKKSTEPSILDEDHIFIENANLDWETLYCPNPGCEYYGKPFKIEWLVRNGSSRGEPQARC